MKPYRFVLLFALLVLIVSPLRASTPSIESVDPPQVIAGEDTAVTLTGRGFDVGARVALLSGGPFIAGSVDTDTVCESVVAVGDLAYAVGGYLEEDYGYYTAQGWLEVFDVRNPQAPERLGRTWLPGIADEVAVVGDFAYVWGHTYLEWFELGSSYWVPWVQVVDVRNPQAPALAGRVDIPEAALDTGPGDLVYVVGSSAVAGNYLYRATGSGLLVFDVGNPLAPALAGRVDIPAAASVAVAGNFAYVSGSNMVGSDEWLGLIQVLDLSDPRAPVLADRLELPGRRSPGSEVAVAGGFAYVAWGGGLDAPPSLDVIDVSNPQVPALAGHVDTQFWRDVADVAVARELAYVATDRGLQVIDVRDPQAPVLAGSISMLGTRGLAAAGDYAYVVDSDTLYAIDCSVPQAPARATWRIDTPGGLRRSITVAGDHAYVADGGLQVVDVSNPESSALAGRVDSPDTTPTDVAAAGGFAYVVGSSNDPSREYVGYLEVVDVRNPQAPALVRRVDMGGPYSASVAVAGDYAYVVQGGLQVFDLRNPEAPTFAGRVDISSYGGSVAVAGNYAYVTGYYGLRVIDVSDPQAPALAGYVELLPDSWDVKDVAVAGDYAYVGSSLGLQVIDVRDPQAPALTGSYYTPGYPRDLTVAGDYAYIVTDFGLQVIDVSDPQSPALAGSYDTPGHIEDVAIAGDYAYITTDHDLHILRLNPPLRDVATLTEGRIQVTVPAGFSPGPYHLRVTNADGQAVTLHNSLRVTERHGYSLDASLVPMFDPASPNITRESVPWRMTVQGDATFFEPSVRHEGLLLLPELPVALATRVEPAGASGQAAIELRRGAAIDAGEVVLIGNDPEQITALWEAARSAGGFALPRLDAHAYGDFALQLSRTPGAGPALSSPLGSTPRGATPAGPAAIRYRYEFTSDGRLTAARASGPDVELTFKVIGRDKSGGEVTDTIRYSEERAAACEGFAALHPQLVMDCSP